MNSDTLLVAWTDVAGCSRSAVVLAVFPTGGDTHAPYLTYEDMYDAIARKGQYTAVLYDNRRCRGEYVDVRNLSLVTPRCALCGGSGSVTVPTNDGKGGSVQQECTCVRKGKD